MKTIKDYNGNNIDFEAAVMLMDDEIREQLHGTGIEDEQEFYNPYCEKHYEKYNEEFARYKLIFSTFYFSFGNIISSISFAHFFLNAPENP